MIVRKIVINKIRERVRNTKTLGLIGFVIVTYLVLDISLNFLLGESTEQVAFIGYNIRGFLFAITPMLMGLIFLLREEVPITYDIILFEGKKARMAGWYCIIIGGIVLFFVFAGFLVQSNL